MGFDLQQYYQEYRKSMKEERCHDGQDYRNDYDDSYENDEDDCNDIY